MLDAESTDWEEVVLLLDDEMVDTIRLDTVQRTPQSNRDLAFPFKRLLYVTMSGLTQFYGAGTINLLELSKRRACEMMEKTAQRGEVRKRYIWKQQRRMCIVMQRGALHFHKVSHLRRGPPILRIFSVFPVRLPRVKMCLFRSSRVSQRLPLHVA